MLTPSSILLIIGTPRQVPIILGNPHLPNPGPPCKESSKTRGPPNERRIFEIRPQAFMQYKHGYAFE